ncbi:BRO-N domain-containing protein [Roseomonas mucosa]|uniref:BRO-N domain-containing protein n=1 Tax=Roseomonas mucosa TaxID=207340 RepID=UPI0038512DF1
MSGRRIEGKPWFVAADVCRAIGYSLRSNGKPNTTRATAGLSGTEKGVHQISTPGGAQDMAVVSESGLYRLIMRSDKPEARQFQDWMTQDVLPAIRKDGAYVMGEEKALAAPAEPMHACGAPGSQGRSGPSHSLACTGAYGG